MLENRPRKPWLAGVLTFLSLGLGHIYAGKAKKGIILFFFQAIVAIVLFVLLMFILNIITLAITLSIGLAYFLFCLTDSIKIAKSNKEQYSLKRYNRWYIYLALYVIAAFIIQPIFSNLVKENITQAYKIPSGAMMPTMLIGDHILVDKFIYKRNTPERGDIVVFKYPKDPSIDYVKRMIAQQDDIVEIKNKKLFINNVGQSESYIFHTGDKIYKPNISPRDNFGPITVPKNSFFVLGDNRDNSADSRFWGFVSNDNLKGKVTAIYWSWDLRHPLFSRARWQSIRWSRIGKHLE